MRVEAYRCDYCGHIKEDDEVMGITPTEDLFDRMLSFPICTNNRKVNIHYCLTCYEKVVLNEARLIDRKKDEREYELKLKELQYLIRSTCVTNVVNRKKFVRLE